MRFSCSNIFVCCGRMIAALSVLVILSIVSLSPVWAQNTHARPSAYSPAGIVALDEAIGAKMAQGQLQAVWDLARQHIDFHYMPPEMLLQIAKLAAQAQSPERALAIIERALQSFPEYGPLHAYGLSLARYLNNCSFAHTHRAYYQHPRNLPIMASILAQNIARFILVMRQPGQKREFWRIWIGYARLAGAGSWAMSSICARRAVCLSIRLPNFKAGR